MKIELLDKKSTSLIIRGNNLTERFMKYKISDSKAKFNSMLEYMGVGIAYLLRKIKSTELLFNKVYSFMGYRLVLLSKNFGVLLTNTQLYGYKIEVSSDEEIEKLDIKDLERSRDLYYIKKWLKNSNEITLSTKDRLLSKRVSIGYSYRSTKNGLEPESKESRDKRIQSLERSLAILKDDVYNDRSLWIETITNEIERLKGLKIDF